MKTSNIIIILGTVALAAQAATIVSVGGPTTFGGSIGRDQVQTVGFSTSVPYSNVIIRALLSGVAGETADAYLTTNIGPGTTPADEVATGTVAFPGGGAAMTTVFTGISLPAGTYYLTLYNPSTNSGAWYSTKVPVITTDAGAAHLFSGYKIYYTGMSPYPPAEDFTALFGLSTDLEYEVLTADVPEPGTITAGLGLLALLAIRRIRRAR